MKSKNKLTLYFLIICLLICNFILLKSQQLYEKQIIPFDGMDHDFFGSSVAIGDSFLFISSIRYSNTLESSVYVYRLVNNDYLFSEKLFSSDGQENDLFGTKLLYFKNKLFVGARNKRINNLPSGIGAVYVFEYKNNHWEEIQIILPPEPYTYGGYFSYSISVDNDFLLIGAERYNSSIENSGKAFIYKFIDDKYELYQDFSPPNPTEDQLFGSSVVIKDSILLISSVYESTPSGLYSGAVYIYKKIDSLWEFDNKYIPEPNSDFLTFGTSLAINNEYIFIGTTAHPNYYSPGKVYIYKYSDTNLNLSQIIETGDKYNNDRFGLTLFTRGDSLLVGALFDSVKSSYPGATYLFVNEEEQWNKKRKIIPSNEENANLFSYNILLNDAKIFISAHNTKVNEIRPGIVYIYSKKPLNIEDDNSLKLENYTLNQNYPNPFNPTTSIQFSIPVTLSGVEGSLVTLKVYDILGREIATLVNEEKPAGTYEVEFDGSSLSSGIYYYKLQAGDFIQTRKMLLVK